MWTTLECRPRPRPVTDGPGRRAHSYGSEGHEPGPGYPPYGRAIAGICGLVARLRDHLAFSGTWPDPCPDTGRNRGRFFRPAGTVKAMPPTLDDPLARLAGHSRSARPETTSPGTGRQVTDDHGNCKGPPPDCHRIVIRLRYGVKSRCNRRTTSTGTSAWSTYTPIGS